MSQYFQAGGHVLWNPSNAVAELFVRSAEALIPVVNQPSGIAPAINDEYEIDMGAFETFVNALVRQYRSTTHLILRSLLEGSSRLPWFSSNGAAASSPRWTTLLNSITRMSPPALVALVFEGMLGG